MFVKLDRELTKDDIGKKVKLRNGDVFNIDGMDNDDKYPIHSDNATYTLNGRIVMSNFSDHDIVEIEHVDEYINVADIPKKPSYDPYYSTIQINIQSGMTVIKGSFRDSSGETWYVTLDKVE
jgi:hypothetical protein